MLDEMTVWRFMCDSCRVTKEVLALAHNTPATPDGWSAGFGERGSLGYPKRVHHCEVCTLRAAEKESTSDG